MNNLFLIRNQTEGQIAFSIQGDYDESGLREQASPFLDSLDVTELANFSNLGFA
ncbi:MAG: hypothetical protein Q4C95_01185 [Planctomycetia bacterium]|nr:hypothetical protein [Planctomycetia bacterium]